MATTDVHRARTAAAWKNWARRQLKHLRANDWPITISETGEEATFAFPEGTVRLAHRAEATFAVEVPGGAIGRIWSQHDSPETEPDDESLPPFSWCLAPTGNFLAYTEHDDLGGALDTFRDLMRWGRAIERADPTPPEAAKATTP